MKSSLLNKLIIILTFLQILFQMVENLEFTRSYIVPILILINFPGVTVCQLNGLVNYFVPNSLKETKNDGIIQFNSWITDVHIETGGDDSTSVTLFGKKLYFICAPRTHSVKFEKLFRNVDDFISFVETGPESSAVKSNIKFYIPQPDLILCQPSLASHAVLTSTLGVSFVWGWEACN